MANRWGNSGNSVWIIFLGSQITEDGDCSHEIKRHLLLGRKAMTNLDSILKSTDFTLPTKVCLVKAMVFPVVMYGCKSWTIKKTECRRIDAFELWERLWVSYLLHWQAGSLPLALSEKPQHLLRTLLVLPGVLPVFCLFTRSLVLALSNVWLSCR